MRERNREIERVRERETYGANDKKSEKSIDTLRIVSI